MTLSIFLDIPDSFKAEIVYTIDNLFFPFLENVDIVDSFNDFQKRRKRLIYCHHNSEYLQKVYNSNDTLLVLLDDQTLAFFSQVQSYDTDQILWTGKTPCLFPTISSSRRLSKLRLFPFDLFAASFFFLSCQQEQTIEDRDQKGRIPLNSTLQHKLGCIRVPIVNEYLKLFNEAVIQLWGSTFETKPMPGGEKTFVALTHDTDYIDCTPGQYLQRLIDDRHHFKWNKSNIQSVLRNAIGRKYIFSKMEEIERRYNARSTHFFLSDYHDKSHQFFFIALVKQYVTSKFEIAHHISDKSIFEQNLHEDNCRFRTTYSEFSGARVHTLRFLTSALFEQLETQGYLYDSSLLFPEDIGYRTGFTYPHYLFDFKNKRPFNVVEIPLNIMDTTLVDRKYLGLADQQAEEEIIQTFKSAISYGGALSLLTHNAFFYLSTPQRLAMYERLLVFLSRNNIGFGPCELLYFWRTGQNSDHLD